MHIFKMSTLCRQSIELNQKKAVVGVDRPMVALSMHLQKNNCLSSHSCHFVKNNFLVKLLHAKLCSMAKYQIALSKAVVGVAMR